MKRSRRLKKPVSYHEFDYGPAGRRYSILFAILRIDRLARYHAEAAGVAGDLSGEWGGAGEDDLAPLPSSLAAVDHGCVVIAGAGDAAAARPFEIV